MVGRADSRISFTLGLVVAVGLGLGLGGAACKPSKQPQSGSGDGTNASASASAQASSAPVAHPDGDEPAPGPASPKPAGTASAEDKRTVLQLVLDDPELDNYLHLGVADRFPLKIAGEGLPEGLTKATKPVVIVSAPADNAPVVVFLSIELSAERASVRYRFGAEHIQGTASLEKGAQGWQLVRSRIVER